MSLLFASRQDLPWLASKHGFMRRTIALLLAVVVAGLVATPARAERFDSDGHRYREEWIPSANPLVEMHADVIRASKYTWQERLPVILVATPYGNHAGQTNWQPSQQPDQNGRFADFLRLSGALDSGYTYVVVDLPGFGGSSGCSDLGGPSERAAVAAAVEWAASQPWSSGRVALFGKSYDGWTGLMGVAERPKGLAAVVAMEPVYSPYTVDFSNGVRNYRSFLLPALYAQIDANPGTLRDSPRYQANSLSRPNCYAWTQANWLNDDESAAFWQERDLPADSVGAATPLFLTQGLLETNTVPRGAFDYFNSLGGAQNRAWYGQFGHYRGWESEVGRGGFVEEAMRFLDQHLRHIQPAVVDPAIAVQDSRGRYRGEDAWPPADALPFSTELTTGVYTDEAWATDTGLTTISQPLPHDVWLAGESKVRMNITTASPRTNVGVHVFDVHDGRAVEVTRDAYLIRQPGTQTIEFDLMGQDWIFDAGHTIAVAVGPPSRSWFTATPTGGPVVVEQAEISFPFLTGDRTNFIGGTVTPDLRRAKWGENEVGGSWSRSPFVLPGPINTGGS